MRMMMVLVPSECLAEVRGMIEEREIHAFTEIPDVRGAGEGGRKMGTRAFPGTTSLFLTIVNRDEADRLVAAVKEYAEERECCHEIRIFALPAEKVF